MNEGSKWVPENVSHMDGEDKQCDGSEGNGSLLGSSTDLGPWPRPFPTQELSFAL